MYQLTGNDYMKKLYEHIFEKHRLKQLNERTGWKMGPQFWDMDDPIAKPTPSNPSSNPLTPYLPPFNNGPPTYANEPIPPGAKPPTSPISPVRPNRPVALPADAMPGLQPPPDGYWNLPDPNNPNLPDPFWFWDREDNEWQLVTRTPGAGGLFSWGVRATSSAVFPPKPGEYFWNPQTGQLVPYGGVGFPIDWWWAWIHGMMVPYLH